MKKAELRSSTSSSQLQDHAAGNRPSYSREYLAELKNSTPSLPKKRHSPPPKSSGTLDITLKFGQDLSRYDPDWNPAIPSEAEIQEKKARRARLAKEQKYNGHESDSEDRSSNLPDQGHDSDEDEFRNQRDTIALSNDSRYPETRLVRDDEDIMEDFDSFMEDGRAKIGRQAEKDHQRRQREEMRDLIANAEGSSSEDSDDSEKLRRADYDSAQTRKGMEGLQVRDSKGPEEAGQRTPPKITPLPSLSSCVERLRGALLGVQAAQKKTMEQLAEVERKRQEIPSQEEEIQRLLKEAGNEYERLRKKAGLDGSATQDDATMISNGTSANQTGLAYLGDAAEEISRRVYD